MESEELETHEESVKHAVDLLERLLITVDGGRGFFVGQYEASTILALLTVKAYRVEVMSNHDDFDDVDESD